MEGGEEGGVRKKRVSVEGKTGRGGWKEKRRGWMKRQEEKILHVEVSVEGEVEGGRECEEVRAERKSFGEQQGKGRRNIYMWRKWIDRERGGEEREGRRTEGADSGRREGGTKGVITTFVVAVHPTAISRSCMNCS